MRIVSYNILNGGEGRADPLAEVIEAQRADVVALVEADDGDVVERIARRLSMDVIVGAGQQHSVALLSRLAILETINHAGRGAWARCFLEAVVRTEAGAELPIAVVHFHPRADEADEREREEEAAGVVAALARHREAGRAHLVVGDFNANSSVQEIDPALVKPATRESWARNGGQIPRRVMGLLAEGGYADTLAMRHPEEAGRSYSFTTQYPGQRVDYVLAWGVGRERVREAWIERDRLATYASDHYPVGAEIEV